MGRFSDIFHCNIKRVQKHRVEKIESHKTLCEFYLVDTIFLVATVMINMARNNIHKTTHRPSIWTCLKALSILRVQVPFE